MMTSSSFCASMPKVELHAHLNGSIGAASIAKLADLHRRNFPKEPIDEAVGTRTLSGFDEGFNYFGVVQKLTDHPEAVALATREVISDFAADNVKYLELRSTPRAVAGRMTKTQYVEAILAELRAANADPSLDIVCKLLLSVDRRQSVEAAGEAVSLCLDYRTTHPDVLVGMDLSGDARVGNLGPLLPLLKTLREDAGLRLSVHLAEVPNEPEVALVLRHLEPDRIGHGTAIHPDFGGSEALWRLLLESQVPVEVCLTSNVVCGSVKSYNAHHVRHLHECGHPVVVCTDDSGAFRTTLSGEYSHLQEVLALSDSEVLKLARRAVDFIFADGNVKAGLLRRFDEFAESRK